MRLLQWKPKADVNANPRMGAMIAGGKAILDLPATLDSGGRGGWLPHWSSNEWWNIDGPVWHLMRSSVDAAARADEKTLEHWKKQNKVVALEEATICAPISRPGKVICIGLNYRDHAIESNLPIPESPIMFTKFASSIVGPDIAVQTPKGCTQLDYEAELAFVVGKVAKNVPKDKAYQYLIGYSCFNDISARDFQFADKQWVRGKACDTFAPMGPFVATVDEVPDPSNLSIKLRLNGQTMQDSRTKELIFGVPELVEFLSTFITLEPGDIVATGTPQAWASRASRRST